MVKFILCGRNFGERLGEEFDGNFDYMNRIFKRVTGQTIFQYLTAVRMEHAKRLIAQTTMHTGVIGQEVGYPDEYYFSKVFKRNVGMSPRAYADSLSKISCEKSLKDKNVTILHCIIPLFLL